jgi:DNA-binding NtrC family response regulator
VNTVVVADSRVDIRRDLVTRLVRRGADVRVVDDAAALWGLLSTAGAALVVLSSEFDRRTTAIDLIAGMRVRWPRTHVVLLAAHGSEELAVAAFRAGVTDYFREPLSDDVLNALSRGDDARDPPPHQPSGNGNGHALSGVLLGESAPMRQVRSQVDRIARVDSNVLITGETGAGKELVAELIHKGSRRCLRPCVCINCAALPDTLVESELFGYERGAFTGADRPRVGQLQEATGGSVFFDEIGDMSLHGQAKILRALEAREIHRLGGRERVPIDVRVISATNQPLEHLVADGRFRKDLYYRLNVSRIHLPPLRERKEDLSLLLNHYVLEFNRRFGREVEGLTPDAFECLLSYDWPGNVRELRNLVEATFINLDSRMIRRIDLPDAFRRGIGESASLPPDERQRMLSALFSTKWNKSKAAQELHWSRMTLYRKMAKYQVSENDPT